jgi:hypothetical protein
MECQEVILRDAATGEHHRADVLCGANTTKPTVLELQHSSISEEERNAREAFYRQAHRMFWLVHIHDEGAFRETNLGLSLDFTKRPIQLDGKIFAVMHWVGSNKQFIEKWKRSRAHVFFDWKGRIFYLANQTVGQQLGGPFERGEFALCMLTRDDFVRAVIGPTDPHASAGERP